MSVYDKDGCNKLCITCNENLDSMKHKKTNKYPCECECESNDNENSSYDSPSYIQVNNYSNLTIKYNIMYINEVQVKTIQYDEFEFGFSRRIDIPLKATDITINIEAKLLDWTLIFSMTYSTIAKVCIGVYGEASTYAVQLCQCPVSIKT